MVSQSIGCLLLVSVLLASCTGGYAPYQQGYYKKGVPIVSASRGTDEYISRETTSYKEYVSALEAAKQEETYGKQIKTNPIDDYVAGLTEESESISSVRYEKLDSPSLSSIWGKPVGSVGEGVTLMVVENRKRFNDALTTTPVGSQAKWRYGDGKFIFMPNSDVYEPYYSGGNCRDGVFIHYDQGREEKIRGLFCQKGRGSDWFYIR